MKIGRKGGSQDDFNKRKGKKCKTEMAGYDAAHSAEHSRKRKLFKGYSGFPGWNGSSGGYLNHRSTYRVSNHFPDKHKKRGSIYLFHDTEKCGINSVKII